MDAPKAKRGRPKKEVIEEPVLYEQELESEPSQLTEIRHVFRVMSVDSQYRPEGSMPKEVIEDHLEQNYFSQGYRLYNVFYVRAVPLAEGGILGHEILYVLVK